LAPSAHTILVVEDEPSVRRTVEQILRHHGYRVMTAEHGEQGLAVADAFPDPIDLVLSDFAMPRMGGLELATRLRVIRPTTRVLFMSGFADADVEAAIASFGSIDVIEKPFRAAALLERIRELLGPPPSPP
jgi:DNA-binding response OmpR family regulator